MLAGEIVTYNSEVEAPFGKVGRVSLFGSIQSMTLYQDCLHQQSRLITLAYLYNMKKNNELRQLLYLSTQNLVANDQTGGCRDSARVALIRRYRSHSCQGKSSSVVCDRS